MSSWFMALILALVSLSLPARGQTYRSFNWTNNGVTNVVIPATEVWEIVTWGTPTSNVRGLDTLFALPGGGALSTTSGKYYSKQNKGDDTANPCGTILVGPATLVRVPNAKAVDYLLVIQKLSTTNSP